jgi:hypothetical protein
MTGLAWKFLSTQVSCTVKDAKYLAVCDKIISSFKFIQDIQIQKSSSINTNPFNTPILYTKDKKLQLLLPSSKTSIILEEYLFENSNKVAALSPDKSKVIYEKNTPSETRGRTVVFYDIKTKNKTDYILQVDDPKDIKWSPENYKFAASTCMNSCANSFPYWSIFEPGRDKLFHQWHEPAYETHPGVPYWITEQTLIFKYTSTDENQINDEIAFVNLATPRQRTTLLKNSANFFYEILEVNRNQQIITYKQTENPYSPTPKVSYWRMKTDGSNKSKLDSYKNIKEVLTELLPKEIKHYAIIGEIVSIPGTNHIIFNMSEPTNPDGNNMYVVELGKPESLKLLVEKATLQSHNE